MKPQRQRNREVIKPQTITRAVTHIRLIEANAGKLAGLDELAPVYLALCQQYLTLFCTEEQPDKFRDPHPGPSQAGRLPSAGPGRENDQ